MNYDSIKNNIKLVGYHCNQVSIIEKLVGRVAHTFY